MLVTEYFAQWLLSQELFLERSTYEALTIYVNRHVIPYFEPLRLTLQELTTTHLQKYANDKMRNGRKDGKGGLSLVSVQKHISVIKQALNEAVRLGLLSNNPAQYVRLPRKKSTHTERMVFLSSEEASRVIDAFEGSELYPVVVITLYYGLRRSEVLGLRWSAVDFRNDTISIEHTVVKNLTIESKDSTKTATSRRMFQLLPEVKRLLLTLYGEGQPSFRYVFCRSDGSPWRPDYLTRAFERRLKLLGLPPMRFHDLRHSTASILFDRGWSLEDVKNWLGHADIETTSNIYLHYGRARKIMLAKDLEGMLLK